MKSKVNLYYQSLVTPEKNFILDSLYTKYSTIENYLSTLTKQTMSGFQYIKHQLSLSIKINKNQTNLEMVDSKDLNYVSITNYDVVNNEDVDEKTYFYFVVNKIWRSTETIELVLAMDTLNTFEYNADYIINKKTLVKRMHKDRFNVYYSKIYLRLKEHANDARYVLQNASVKLYSNATDYWEVKSITYNFLGGIAHTFGVDLSSLSDREIKDLNNYLKNNNSFYKIVSVIYEYSNYEYSSYYGTISDMYLTRKIDFYNEGINPVLYKKSKQECVPPENTHWYLVYKNHTSATLDNPSPLDCYLVPEDSLKVKYSQGGNVINASLLDDSYYYVFAYGYNRFQFNITFKFDGVSVSTEWMGNPTTQAQYVIVLSKVSSNVKVQKYYYHIGLGNTWTHSLIDEWTTSEVILEGLIENITKCNKTASLPTGIYEEDGTQDISFTTTEVTLNSFNSLDKSDTYLNKIIAIPYLPFNYTFESGVLVISGDWTYDTTTKFIKLTNLSPKFKSLIETSFNSPLKEVFIGRTTNLPDLSNLETPRNDTNESKLFNSEFYYSKFTYDSFSFIFKAECIDELEMPLSGSILFEFNFVMTTTINSRFLFEFEDYKLLYSTEDFDNILNVGRNNEETIYSSAYLNYLRTSYNYDVKAKERTIASSLIGGGLNLVGSGAGIGLALGAVNPAVAVSGVISGTSSIASSIMNTINTIASTEETFQKNIDLMKAQSVSVIGSDDIDLMKYYSNNRGWMLEYELSPRLKKVVGDLFYYCGYSVNEQYVPIINSRYWFNYVQASLIITESSNLPSEIEDDIKEKFEQGVTFLHAHSRTIDDEVVPHFDFNQEYENWEMTIVGG